MKYKRPPIPPTPVKSYSHHQERTTTPFPTLNYEYKVYSHLKGYGIPQVYNFGHTETYNYMIMDLLGPSLDTQLLKHDCAFNLKLVIQLADCIIQRLEHIHNHLFIHRDIKPENFCIGKNNPNCVYLIDFGLSKRYFDPKTMKHISFALNKRLIGTARYSSINSHLGCEQSRRDDIEGLGHMLIFLLNGHLPWERVPGFTMDERFSRIGQKKQTTSLEELCDKLPRQFLEYMKIARSLAFEEEPDYWKLRKLFWELY